MTEGYGEFCRCEVDGLWKESCCFVERKERNVTDYSELEQRSCFVRYALLSYNKGPTGVSAEEFFNCLIGILPDMSGVYGGFHRVHCDATDGALAFVETCCVDVIVDLRRGVNLNALLTESNYFTVGGIKPTVFYKFARLDGWNVLDSEVAITCVRMAQRYCVRPGVEFVFGQPIVDEL